MTKSTLEIFLSGLLLGLPLGCGSNQVEIGEQNVDGQASGADSALAGNSGSSQGGATASSTKLGGATAGASSASVGGATSATGGRTSTNTASPGGSTGAGGTSGTDNRCGGIAGLKCPVGSFCEITDFAISDAMGTCMAIPVACDTIYQPICGSDGKTYNNECEAHRVSISKLSDGACPTPDAGAGGSGGNARTGGTTASGGTTARGGTIASGGTTAKGGTTGTGGITGITCGGTVCKIGMYCSYPPGDCGTGNATGTCAAIQASGCTADYTPVCGCDGKTYSNNCALLNAGVSKLSDGECGPRVDAGIKDAAVPGDASRDSTTIRYAGAYLAWQAPGGVAGTGPAIVVSGAGWADTWTNVSGFVKSTPETPPSSATKTYTLTTAEVDDLFGRLASVDFTKLPHTGTVGWECYPYLYLRLCTGCTPMKLDYNIPAALLPEMESVWAWFDSMVTAASFTNPRNYCALP